MTRFFRNRKVKLLAMTALVSVPLAFISSTDVIAQQIANIRAWAHNDFGRIVFDLPAATNHTVDITGKKLTIRLTKPVQGNLNSVKEQLKSYIKNGQVLGDGRIYVFDLVNDYTVKSFKNGNSVVIDLRAVNSSDNQTLPKLPVRVGEHPTYTRFVFDWTNKVDYQANLVGQNLSIRFSKNARVDQKKITQELPKGFSGLGVSERGNGLEIALKTPPGGRLKHFKVGNKVVVDVFKDENKKNQEVVKKSEDLPSSQTVEKVTEKQKEAPSLVAGLTEENAAVVTEAPVKPKTVNVTAEPTLKDILADSNKADIDNSITTTSEAENKLEKQQKADKNAEKAPVQTETVGISSEVDKAVESALESGRLQLQAPTQEDLARKLAEKREKRIKEDISEVVFSLDFPWLENVNSAVFRRGPFVWIIFDKKKTFDLAKLRKQAGEHLEKIEQMPSGNATIIRASVPGALNPGVIQDGNDWILEFRNEPIKPDIQVGIEADVADQVGPHIDFPMDKPGAILNIVDPDVGDVLIVGTVGDPGVGVAGQRNYPEFNFLATAQGVAVELVSDGIKLDRELDGFRLTSIDADGLHISAVSPEAEVGSAAQLSSKRLFNFDKWRLGGLEFLDEDRASLMDEIQNAPTDRRNLKRYDLANYYLANGLGPEAKAVFGTIAHHEPNVVLQPDYRALIGAAHVLNRDPRSAMQSLNDPRLDGFTEVAVWRAAALGRNDRWKDAAELFLQGDSLLLRYPYPIKGELGILRIEAALATRDLRSAENWTKELDKDYDKLRRDEQAALTYFQARIALAKNKLDDAAEIWSELVDGTDQYNAARAKYALINLDLKQETINVEEAINALDKLRYTWRGDELERAILRRLSDLYFQSNNYRDGLNILKTVVSYYPETDLGRKMALEMSTIFKDLYLHGDADKLPPLKALAIYDEFRELTPPGEEGDVMIEKLADRLIDVDLLNRAAALLDHQVRFRLQGEERARVGAKLALVQLIDSQPEEAIRALNASQSPEISEDLIGDRRRLRAKAAFELGDLVEAIKLLAGDVSKEADMLRRDMYWAEENWSEVSRVLQSLAGAPPEEAEVGVSDEVAGYVLNWAVALRLDGDEDGIDLLNELYGPAMQYSSLANAYNFIATSVNSDKPERIQDMIIQLANSDMFDAFVNNYRDKLLDDNGNRDGETG